MSAEEEVEVSATEVVEEFITSDDGDALAGTADVVVKKKRGRKPKKKKTPEEVAVAAAAAAAKTVKEPRPPAPHHPPTQEMVDSALAALNMRSGSSLIAIKRYIGENYPVDVGKLSYFIKRYIKMAVSSGKIIQAKGTGAAGSFKLSLKAKHDLTKLAPAEAKPVTRANAASAKRNKATGKKAAAAKGKNTAAKMSAAAEPAGTKKATRARAAKGIPTKPRAPKPKSVKKGVSAKK